MGEGIRRAGGRSGSTLTLGPSPFALREAIVLIGHYQIPQGLIPHADPTHYKACGGGEEALLSLRGREWVQCLEMCCCFSRDKPPHFAGKEKVQKEAITQMRSHLRLAAYKNLDRDCRMGTDWRLSKFHDRALLILISRDH